MTTFSNCISVVDLPLNSTSFSLENAAPRQYRFLNVQLVLEGGRLNIYAFSQLPTQLYAAVSYVWRGLKSSGNIDSSFEVKGIEEEPKVPISTVKTICLAASKLNCPLVWLDKLCMRQDDKASEDGRADKEWQVQQMHQIYSRCSTCLVLPGGLGRLAALDESTTWIERAWTLQEALAPSSVQVLIDWHHDDTVLQHNKPVFVWEIAPGKGAVVELKSLLEASLKREVKVIPNEHTKELGDYRSQKLRILADVKESGWHLINALLGAIDHHDDDGRSNAIWRCTTLRSARYQVDMIYSIMGLMHVTLPISYEKHPKDVVVELTQALSQKGRGAEWLGIWPSLGASSQNSAMPILPMSTNKDLGSASKEIALVETAPGKLQEVKKLLDQSRDDHWWWLKGTPRGEIDDDGFLTFTSRCTPIVKSNDNRKYPIDTAQRDYPDTLIQCTISPNKRIWKMVKERTIHYAIVIGKKQLYNNGIFGTAVVPDSTFLMIVEDRGHRGFRNLGYAWADENIGETWTERTFKVGD